MLDHKTTVHPAAQDAGDSFLSRAVTILGPRWGLRPEMDNLVEIAVEEMADDLGVTAADLAHLVVESEARRP